MTVRNPAGKSAAEIGKPEFSVLTISEADCLRLLDYRALLDGLADGFRDFAQGKVQVPNRPEITVPSTGFVLSMPAWREGSPVMVKMVSVFEGNLSRELPNHLALINLFDPETGAPLCVMDGTYITAIRTAGSAVLSVQELSRRDSKTVTIVGAGVQGLAHLRLLPLVRDFEEILISSLYFDDAEKLASLSPQAKAADDLKSAIQASDVVCLATHAYEPVIEATWVKPGTHVTSVGYAPPNGELPTVLAKNNSLYVESDVAFEAPPVGCGELRGISPQRGRMLGDALIGKAPLRSSDQEITVYKAMGIAMEDLVAAELIYAAAIKESGLPYVSI